MNLDESIDKFQSVTGFKLNEYLLRVDYFFKNQYESIYGWYEGSLKKPNSDAFKALNILLSTSSEISQLFYKNRNTFSDFSFWDLLSNLEEIQNKLQTTSNLSKILRSTRTKNNFSNTISTEYTTKKYETLETVSRKILGDDSYDDKWVDIAIQNELSEGDYDTEGGQSLTLSTDYIPSQYIESIVDNPIGEKMYGKDINRKITFSNDDIETLSYKETVLQSLDIFLELRKGTVPENMNIGFDESLIVGSNRGVFQFSKLQQQMLNIFNTDDSFSYFKINTFNFIEDGVFIEFETNTILNETLNKNLTL